MGASASRFGRPSVVLAAGLVVAVVAAFGESGSFGFVDYDDGDYVFRNPRLLHGDAIERLRWAFTTFHAANWHPLTWLSFIVDGALFGLDPAWLHRENVLLHALNAVLALALLARATGRVGASALVAGLFALHPLRVESVAWVTERKGLLMAFFALLALHAHVARARRPGVARSLSVAALGAAAMLAKPQAVVLPLVMLVADWWPLGRFGSRPPGAAVALVREKAPLLLAACGVTALTVAAQRQGGAVAPLEALGVGERVASAVVAPAAYLVKTLLPARLSPVYPYAAPAPWQAGVALLALAGVTVAAVRLRAAQPWFAAGWAGFLVLLVPVSNLFQAGGQSIADRYTYLPHLPLLTAAVWAGTRSVRGRPGARRVAAGLCLLAAVAAGIAAHRQTRHWRDDLALFSHAVSVTRGNWKMHYNLGNALEQRGRDDDAEAQYRLALAARPGFAEALNNLGALSGRRGDVEAAGDLFAAAARARPGYGPAWFNLGFQAEQRGDLAAALQDYGRAAALQPAAAEPRVRAGRVLIRLGRPEDAAVWCREALRLDPGSAGAEACLREAAGVRQPAAR